MLRGTGEMFSKCYACVQYAEIDFRVRFWCNNNLEETAMSRKVNDIPVARVGIALVATVAFICALKFISYF